MANELRRNCKAYVFEELFQNHPKNLLNLYSLLHPEDKDVTEDKITDVTIRNVIAISPYNDLGFMVGNKLIILLEAQSTWTENILVRYLIYVGETLKQYLEKDNSDVYGYPKVAIPRIELYLVYSKKAMMLFLIST
ncbi:MAG: hypothetical protein HUK23_04320 [Sphaerochaetaceae bacterium]|nr:hypothetical protein [Sphaerochaetaceae bacterium]